MHKTFLKRSWVTISIDTLRNNLRIYLKYVQDSCDIMAVVKADAYGHGARRISIELQKEGIKNFAVSNVLEAVELRNAGIKGQILVLGYTPIEDIDIIYKHDITQAILSKKYADDIIKTKYKIKCQYAIDTGMKRIGLNADNIKQCENDIRELSKKLILTGLFTHLSVADNPSENVFTNEQQLKFKKVIQSVNDLNLPYIHSLNSAGGLWHHDYMSNLNRLGIILYGLKPDNTNILPKGIKPIMEWKSVISMIKTVKPDETIGYGRSYIAKNKMRIATIPTGYADGYNRLLSNKGYILIHGKRAPIVGRICMDQFMVDITHIPEAKEYDEVTLLGKSENEVLTADDVAQIIQSIGYEVVCDIGKRIPRVYSN